MAKYLDATGVSTLWSKVKEYGTTTASAAVKTITDTKGAKNGIASLDSNGYVPLSQLGNLDTTFAEVVTALPTSNIKKHLYLVKSSDTSQNLYSEYIYTGDTTATYDASKWEKLGEYKADVDLSGYAKKSEVLSGLTLRQDSTAVSIYTYKNGAYVGEMKFANATSSVPGVMSASDKAKLDGIAANANNYSLPTASASTLGGIKVGSNLSINNGVLSGYSIVGSGATTVTNNGAGTLTISSTDTDTHYVSKTIVGAARDATADATTADTVFLNHLDNNIVTSSHRILGKDGATVTAEAGVITIRSRYTADVEFKADDEAVTLTITDNANNAITSGAIPIATIKHSGVLAPDDYAQFSAATADSAITATELAAILV